MKRIPSTTAVSPSLSSASPSSSSAKQAWNPNNDDDGDLKSFLPPNTPSNFCSSSKTKPNSPVALSSLLTTEEFSLLKNLTDFVMTTSLATCSFMDIPSSTEDSTTPSTLQQEEHEGEKSTGTKKNSSKDEKSIKAELVEREMLQERKVLKLELIEEGVIDVLGRLVCHDDNVIKVKILFYNFFIIITSN